MSVSLVPLEVELPGPDEGHGDHEGCLICTTSRTPDRAYRPHMLDGECWCVRGSDGMRYLVRCWVAKVYLAE